MKVIDIFKMSNTNTLKMHLLLLEMQYHLKAMTPQKSYKQHDIQYKYVLLQDRIVSDSFFFILILT